MVAYITRMITVETKPSGHWIDLLTKNISVQYNFAVQFSWNVSKLYILVAET